MNITQLKKGLKEMAARKLRYADERRGTMEIHCDGDASYDERSDRELRDYCVDLKARNKEEIDAEQFFILRKTLESNMSEWKLSYKVTNDGVDILEGDRRIATVYNPLDAERVMEILNTHSFVTKIAVDSIQRISDLQRHVFGDKSKESVQFVTDANYMLGVLKKQPSVNLGVEK